MSQISAALMALSGMGKALTFGAYGFMGHTEQVSQRIGINLRQANQHGIVSDVVVRDLINFRIGLQQFSSVVEIHANR